jgi:hypothetical protein
MCKKIFYFVLVLSMCFSLAHGQEGLIGHWRFDESSGTIAADSAGDDNNGALSENVEWQPFDGKLGGGLLFDGESTAHVEISTEGMSASEGTVSVWGYLSEPQPSQTRYFFGHTTQPPYNNRVQLYMDGGNTELDLGLGDSHTRQTNIMILETERWYHVALTWEAGNYVVYVDSVEVATGTYTGLAALHPFAWIGNDGNPETEGTEAFGGMLDDVRLYDRALSANEIQTAMRGEPYPFASRPNPKDGSLIEYTWAIISWSPGDFAISHDVYFSDDFDAVNEGATEAFQGNQVETSMAVGFPGLIYQDDGLTRGTTYYWRIDEVNDNEPNSPWKGNVWSFTTANYIVVEDFEDYNDYEPDTIYLTWIDGWDDPSNGATSGYPNPIFGIGEHYMETTIVHGGAQSMPLFYDNSAGLSEVTKTLNADWTEDDVVALTLFYYGDAGNEVEPMYIAVDGSAVVNNDDPRAVLANDWIQWNIPLQEFTDQGVDLTNVATLSIGLGNKAAPQAGGGSGHVFIDDIRLYRALPEEPEPRPESVDPGTDNLVAYYSFENNTEDGSGNGYNATASSSPRYVPGPTGYGMALDFDGANDYVRLPIGSAIASMSDITVATWANFSNLGGSWQRLWDFGSDEQINMFLTPRIGTAGALRFAITIAGNTAEANITASATLPSGWHHVSAVIDSASMTMKLYQDGKLVAEGPTLVLPSDLGETTENFLGRSQYAADSYYFGSLDEFRIYDRALSIEEVLFLAGK